MKAAAAKRGPATSLRPTLSNEEGLRRNSPEIVEINEELLLSDEERDEFDYPVVDAESVSSVRLHNNTLSVLDVDDTAKMYRGCTRSLISSPIDEVLAPDLTSRCQEESNYVLSEVFRDINNEDRKDSLASYQRQIDSAIWGTSLIRSIFRMKTPEKAEDDQFSVDSILFV